MDLLRRGIDEDEIEKYIDDELYEFEEKCAIALARKKYKATGEIDKVKRYLMSKGYSHSNVSKAIDNLGNMSDN